MTSDVATKVITGNDIGQGNVVTALQKTGVYQILEPTISEDVQSVESLESQLTTRLDDPTYYTA